MITSTDYLVIGAGPVGSQLGHLLSHAGRDHLLLPGVADISKDKHFRVIGTNGEVIQASTLIATTTVPGLTNEQTSEWESTNLPGLYFAGQPMRAREDSDDRRCMVRALHRLLERKNHGIDWPHTSHVADPVVLTDVVLSRVRHSPALRELADVIVQAGRDALHYKEMPVEYVHESAFADDYLTVTVEDAATVRHFHRGTFLAEHQVTDARALTEFLAERLLQTILTAATH
jgi:hypothetical protein